MSATAALAVQNGRSESDCERQHIAKPAPRKAQLQIDDHDALVAQLRIECAPVLQDAAEALHAEPGTLQIAVVPYNAKALTALPDARRSALEAHLRAIATEGFAVENPDIYTSKYIRKSIDQPEAGITDAACATCMGHCCKAGGPNWGFTDMTTVCRFRVANPAATADDFCAYYIEHLPERSIEDNCVFQSDKGCTLDRKDRADLCNSFLCRGVNRIQSEHATNGAGATAIIALHEGTPKSIGLFDATTDQLSNLLPVEADK